MKRVDGKVALITGAARGQGRSHAQRLAEEGADIIAIDICSPIATADHTMSTKDDLAETVALVEKHGRRVIAIEADVRDRTNLESVVADAVKELGRLDVVVANAGIFSMSPLVGQSEQTWQDVIDVNLTGVFHTINAAVPHIISGGRGGSVIMTSSAAGAASAPLLGHYAAAKHGVLGLMKTLAIELGPQFVRVNAVLPSNTDTEMIQNDKVLKLFMPHLESPTREDGEKPDSAYVAVNAIPVPWMQPIDISNAVLFLASDESRYVTGISLPIDAGFLVKTATGR